MADFVCVDITTHTATVTLNRPDVHNAFNEQVIAELIDVFTALSTNPDVRAVVLRSAGESFCAGADLNWMKKMVSYTYEENLADASELARLLRTIRTCTKPTITRVHGSAFGGGVGLVAACDIAVAVESAKFSFSEVKLGLVPGVISPVVLEKIGTAQASRYFMTAETFDASTAQQMNLIHETMADAAALDTAVDKLVDKLVKNGPQATQAAKQLIIDVQQPAWLSREAVAVDHIAKRRVSDEGQEGIQAFLEKRKPNWLASEVPE